MGEAFEETFPFLLSHTAADPDDDLRATGLKMLETPGHTIDLFLGLTTHRAGIDQDEIRLLRGLTGYIFPRKKRQKALRIVFVHLAAEGTQINLLHNPAYFNP